MFAKILLAVDLAETAPTPKGLDEAVELATASGGLLRLVNIQPLLPAMPEGVDLAIRSGNGKRVFILTNYAVETQTVTLPSPMEDILQGGKVTSVTLPQYGVAVLR